MAAGSRKGLARASRATGPRPARRPRAAVRSCRALGEADLLALAEQQPEVARCAECPSQCAALLAGGDATTDLAEVLRRLWKAAGLGESGDVTNGLFLRAARTDKKIRWEKYVGRLAARCRGADAELILEDVIVGREPGRGEMFPP